MRKQKILFFLSFLTLSFLVKAQPVFNWVSTFGSAGSNYAYSMISDPQGNVYTTGSFSGTTDFDPGPGVFTLTSSSPGEIFVSKLNSSGGFVWAVTFSGAIGKGADIALDASGNVYTTGFYTGTVDFDPGVGTFNLSALGSQDAFVSKISPAGAFVWARSMGGGSPEEGQGIALDNSGNIYTTGFTQGVGDYDPGPGFAILNPIGSADCWISKLDGSGNFVWVKQFGGTNTGTGKTIKTDSGGNICIGGAFSGDLDLDPGPGSFILTSAGSTDIFVSKLNSSGSFIWAKGMGGIFGDYCNSLAFDAADNVYSIGAFANTADLDPGAGTFNLTSNGLNDIYISKLDASGSFVWAKQIGGPNDDAGESIKLDASGNIYTAGAFESTVDFDPGAGIFNMASLGSDDVFIHKLDNSGSFQWALKFGGAAQEIAKSIDVDAGNDVHTAGFFESNLDFDPGAGTFTLNPSGNVDIFVHKMCPVPNTPTNISTSADQNICSGNSASLTAAGSGTINWYNVPSGGSVLGTGTTYVTPTLSIGNYSFYAESMVCTASPTRAVFEVTVTILPVYSVSTSIALLCVGQSATLYASGVTNCTWMPGGITGTAAVVSPTVTTSYTAYGSNGGCANAVKITQSVSSCTDIGFPEQLKTISDLKILPNPFNSLLTISSSALPNSHIEIFNLTGELIYSENISEEEKLKNGTLQINLNGHSSGIYFLRIKNNDAIGTARVVKE
jgi:hypothetical protein